MTLREYFESKDGMGILSTADTHGRVNSALYARPHVIDENTLAFIMRERLSYRNLQSNPHACYLFAEDGPGYAGKRLYLTMTGEETNTDVIEKMRRRQRKDSDCEENKSLVYFRVDRIRPLVGDEDSKG
ncbi:MAG: pyridoxamine 5'-phosphate oxidase family protein [Phycisphaerae bacterium]|nr:pyridoxamine 5'-phosphate oxidase family protein [Phycisphaerae bacterium]